MYSDLRPLFDQIDKYYEEVNVSLRAEEHYLKTIRKTLRVTPDDKLRWEHIRDACQDACRLLAAQPYPSPPHRPQLTTNKAAHNIQALANTVINARNGIQQTHRRITPLTQRPQFDLLRLKSEYESGEQTCRERISEVFEFSERIVPSFVEVRATDDFRDHLLPAAAASSSQTLQHVAEELRHIMPTVQYALPHTADLFARFECYLPIADSSMQRVYGQLRELVQPLEQPNDPNRGVLRHLTRVQLREEQHAWRMLQEQWANQL
ncbi:hypothetical protein BGW80DRAFT_1318753 [Lactifluus volemus]|nr:hypothetical protein BGW80DRAFT_1318753 [Lactifluus volemus]